MYDKKRLETRVTLQAAGIFRLFQPTMTGIEEQPWHAKMPTKAACPGLENHPSDQGVEIS
ncbi:MAG: hypothetical protein V5B38_10330 [Candidatus Accumulibacter propinquus]